MLIRPFQNFITYIYWKETYPFMNRRYSFNINFPELSNLMLRTNKLYLVYMYAVFAFLSFAMTLRVAILLNTFTACLHSLRAGVWHLVSTVTRSTTVVINPSDMVCILTTVTTAATPKVRISVGGLIPNGAEILVTPDTRADRSACGMYTIEALGIDSANLRDPSIELKAAHDHVIHQVGEFDVTLVWIFHKIQRRTCPEGSKIQAWYFWQACFRSVWTSGMELLTKGN